MVSSTSKRVGALQLCPELLNTLLTPRFTAFSSASAKTIFAPLPPSSSETRFIVLAAFLGPNSWNVVIAIGLLLWPNAGRIIRSQVLTLRERGYIESAKVSGCSNFRIIFMHIAPNILPLSFLYGSIAIGWAILTEASISFLGFGPSDVISWGYMLQDAYSSQALSLKAYIWFIPPGICIVLMVVAGFFISRGYEEILFPKIKE